MFGGQGNGVFVSAFRRTPESNRGASAVTVIELTKFVISCFFTASLDFSVVLYFEHFKLFCFGKSVQKKALNFTQFISS